MHRRRHRQGRKIDWFSCPMLLCIVSGFQAPTISHHCNTFPSFIILYNITDLSVWTSWINTLLSTVVSYSWYLFIFLKDPIVGTHDASLFTRFRFLLSTQCGRLYSFLSSLSSICCFTRAAFSLYLCRYQAELFNCCNLIESQSKVHSFGWPCGNAFLTALPVPTPSVHGLKKKPVLCPRSFITILMEKIIICRHGYANLHTYFQPMVLVFVVMNLLEDQSWHGHVNFEASIPINKELSYLSSFREWSFPLTWKAAIGFYGSGSTSFRFLHAQLLQTP